MRKTMTWGVMPSREEFDEAWDAQCDERFAFGNDPRLGTCALSQDELWEELLKAHAESQAVDGSSDDGGAPERAGDWCSAVLYCLGFEWV